ncbi:MAG: GNAT family protein [Bacteroidota bacterium]
MFSLSFTLQTTRYLLRSPKEADIPHIFSATRYAGFNDGMPWEPPEKEENCYPSMKRSIARWQAGTSYTFSIVKKGEDQLIGRIEIRKTDTSDIWSVGFWTHPSEQGQGLMSECLAEVLKFGFEELKAKEIEAAYATWNAASEKVLHKNGMKFVRFIEKGFEKRGKWVAENEVSLTLDTWKSLSQGPK